MTWKMSSYRFTTFPLLTTGNKENKTVDTQWASVLLNDSYNMKVKIYAFPDSIYLESPIQLQTKENGDFPPHGAEQEHPLSSGGSQ